MSVRIMSMVFDNQELSSTEKLVMLALADHANDEGKSIYPSQDRLAMKTGLSRETINRHVKRLIQKGIIRKIGYRGDRANVLEVEIVVESLLTRCDGESHLPQEGVTEDHTRCDGESQAGVTEDHTNHHINHQLNIKEVCVGETDLLTYFEQISKIQRPIELINPYEVIKWEKEISRWESMGAIKADVLKAIQESDERNTTLSWPGSITSYLKSIIARRNRGVKSNPKKPYKGKNRETAEELYNRLKAEEAALHTVEIIDG